MQKLCSHLFNQKCPRFTQFKKFQHILLSVFLQNYSQDTKILPLKKKTKNVLRINQLANATPSFRISF